jgi:probable F420-dependent oxidoreductase
MDVGAVFPQLEIGDDPAVVERYARTAERVGYDHVAAYDHVLGVDEEDVPYDYRDQFHEPLTLYAFLAGVTDALELVTSVLVLPQRQTALVAKQAAEVDVLSGGRTRLGVGVGWNRPEYVALGQPFEERGRRIEEQVELLRALWTDELVDFDGDYHRVPEAGINPLPVQRPIPVWMGGTADRVLRRVARLADGYMPQFRPGPDAEETLDRLYGYARDAGRDPDDLGLHGRLRVDPEEPGEWVERARAWADLGADHVSVNAMYHGLDPGEHVALLERVGDRLADAGLL